MSENIKEEIIKLFEVSVNRKGSDKIINLMKKTDFFVAPASTKHHLNYEGGLAEHSYNVYNRYLELVDTFNQDIPLESIIIESICHDFCKIGLYKKDIDGWSEKQESYLNNLVKSNATLVAESDLELEFTSRGKLKPLSREFASKLIGWLSNNPTLDNCPDREGTVKYVYDNNFPAGHGEKSIFTIQRFMRLKKREILAIRWHMGAFEDGVFQGYKSADFNQANNLYPDVKLLHLADMESSFKEDWT